MVKGAALRSLSRRGSQVQILPHAFRSAFEHRAGIGGAEGSGRRVRITTRFTLAQSADAEFDADSPFTDKPRDSSSATFSQKRASRALTVA